MFSGSRVASKFLMPKNTVVKLIVETKKTRLKERNGNKSLLVYCIDKPNSMKENVLDFKSKQNAFRKVYNTQVSNESKLPQGRKGLLYPRKDRFEAGKKLCIFTINSIYVCCNQQHRTSLKINSTLTVTSLVDDEKSEIKSP